MSSNVGEVFTMFFGVLLAKPLGLRTHHGTIVLPLLATQILRINLVTDGAPALALGVDPADGTSMDHSPRPRMAFTTLVFAQLINVFNARSDVRSAFVSLFANHWLWAAVSLSLGPHLVVLYVPVMQRAFGTMALTGADWLRCAVAASTVLWLSELLKLLTRRGGRDQTASAPRAA